MRAAAAALVGLLCLGVASSALAAHFDVGAGGMDGWTHSEDAKYSGKFKATDAGLTVRLRPPRPALRLIRLRRIQI